jgi:hypothetical protein
MSAPDRASLNELDAGRRRSVGILLEVLCRCLRDAICQLDIVLGGQLRTGRSDPFASLLYRSRALSSVLLGR